MAWVYELKGPGRYVIHRRATGKGRFEYWKRWVEEGQIQAIWRDAGRELPEANREPELPHVAEVRLQVILRRFLWTPLFFSAVLYVMWRLAKRAKAAFVHRDAHQPNA